MKKGTIYSKPPQIAELHAVVHQPTRQNKKQYLFANLRHAWESSPVFRQLHSRQITHWLKRYWFYIAASLLIILIIKNSLPAMKFRSGQQQAAFGTTTHNAATNEPSATTNSPAPTPKGPEKDGQIKLPEMSWTLQPSSAAKEHGQEQNAQAFVLRFAKVAQQEAQKFGVPASVLLALGIYQQQQWSKKTLEATNNPFGLTCGTAIEAKAIGKAQVAGACLLKFQSAWDGFRAHSLLLSQGDYAKLTKSKTAKASQWLTALQATKYSTASDFTPRIQAIIDTYHLLQYDK